MTNQSQATAAPMQIVVGGQTYRMAPLAAQDIAELDNWLRSRVIRMARESIEPDTPRDVQETTMRAALSHANTLTWMSGEGAKLLATVEGMAQLIWQGLHRNHPAVRPEDIRAAMMDPEHGGVDLASAVDAFNMLNSRAGTTAKKKKRRPPTPTASRRLMRQRTRA